MPEYAEYPFASHFLTLSEGLRCHYVDELDVDEPDVDEQTGVDASRRVLLFLHGNPTWSFLWRRLIAQFRDRFRCVALDHIGCGLSDKPYEEEYHFTLEQRIRDTVQFIERLDLRRITLIAHDWGGAIGMGTAARIPERFERFVLMNTAAFRSAVCPLRIRLCRMPVFGRLAVQQLNLFSLGTLWMATARRKNLSKEFRTALLAPYNSRQHRTAVYRFVQDIPLSPRHPSYQTLLSIEKSLPMFREHPVCLIWGMLDWCFSPEYLKRFLQFFPGADVHRLEKAHHLLLEDAPKDVADALETFLRQF